MRIAIVAPPWLPVPPPAYGGTEGVLDRLARGLKAAGHDVVLVSHPASTCPVERRSALPILADVEMGHLLTELRWVLGAGTIVADADIVHDHTLAGPLLAAYDAPTVTTNHGPFDVALTDLYRVVAKKVPIIAISRAQAERSRNIPIRAVIHHGVDVDEFPEGTGRGGYLAFLGRMTAEKGVHRAIEVARLAGRRLLIAAKMREEAERAYFEDRVRPLLDDQIVFLGELNHVQKLQFLADAAALLNPIRWPEPFGLAMIESLACGTPVLAFAEGSVPEIVVHGVNGFICTDEDDMAASVEAALRLERAASRAHVADAFSARRMVQQHVDLYEQLIAESRSGSSAVVENELSSR